MGARKVWMVNKVHSRPIVDEWRRRKTSPCELDHSAMEALGGMKGARLPRGRRTTVSPMDMNG